MPFFLQVILWVSGAITAFGIIWTKVAKPLVSAIVETQVTKPVIRALVKEFHDPSLLSVISEIAEQFKNNSGSTLRDGFDRIEAAQHQLKLMTETEIKIAREQMAYLSARINSIDAAADRIEASAIMVSKKLSEAQTSVKELETRVSVIDVHDASDKGEGDR